MHPVPPPRLLSQHRCVFKFSVYNKSVDDEDQLLCLAPTPLCLAFFNFIFFPLFFFALLFLYNVTHFLLFIIYSFPRLLPSFVVLTPPLTFSVTGSEASRRRSWRTYVSSMTSCRRCFSSRRSCESCRTDRLPCSPCRTELNTPWTTPVRHARAHGCCCQSLYMLWLTVCVFQL